MEIDGIKHTKTRRTGVRYLLEEYLGGNWVYDTEEHEWISDDDRRIVRDGDKFFLINDVYYRDSSEYDEDNFDIDLYLEYCEDNSLDEPYTSELFGYFCHDDGGTVDITSYIICSRDKVDEMVFKNRAVKVVPWSNPAASSRILVG